MIAKWKKTLRLLSYSYKFQWNMWVGVLYLAIAVIAFCFGLRSGVKAIMCSMLFMYLWMNIWLQLKDNLMFSSMIQASPRKRMLDITFSGVQMFLSSFITYLIEGSIFLGYAKHHGVEQPGGLSVATTLFICAFLLICVNFYLGVYNKYYFSSLVFWTFTCMIIYGMSDISSIDALGNLVQGDPVKAFIIGLGLVALSGMGAGILRRLLYKKPISKYSGSSNLYKSMQ